MYLYRKAYIGVDFLKNQQSDNFIAWICPLMQEIFVPMDMIIYYETDPINEVYFLMTGFAGFVLPFQTNVVFIEIKPGDKFGEIDYLSSVTQNKNCNSVEQLINYIHNEKLVLVRQFTI